TVRQPCPGHSRATVDIVVTMPQDSGRPVGVRMAAHATTRESSVTAPTHTRTAPFIAADVGGTHVRMSLVAVDGEGAMPQVLAYSKFRCSDYASLADIVREFIASLGRHPV